MFSRYAGMNQSPIPPGYMESAAQEAQIYANMGANIANMMFKDTELKQQEKATAAKTDENAINKRKTDVAEYTAIAKAKNDADTLAADIRNKQGEQFSSGFREFRNRMEEIKVALEDEKDPKKRNQLENELSVVQKDLQSLTEGYRRYMGFGENTSPSNVPSTYDPQGISASWNKLRAGPGAIIAAPPNVINRRIIESVVPNSNPPEAPSAAKGAEGGLDGKAMRAAGIPVAPKMFMGGQILAQAAPETSPRPKSPASSGSMANLTPPQLYNGDLGIKLNVLGKTSNSGGRPTTGNITAELLPNGGINYGIQVNSELYETDSNGNPVSGFSNETAGKRASILGKNPQSVAREYRDLHVLKFILDNNLQAGILPSADEKKVANDVYGADKAKDGAFSIQQAVALLLRDQSPDVPHDASNLSFHRAFRTKFKIGPDDYLVQGLKSGGGFFSDVGTSLPRFEGAVEAKAVAYEVAKRNAPNIQDAGIPIEDPSKKERAGLQEQLNKVESRLGKIADTSLPIYKKYEKDRQRILDRLKMLADATDAWSKQTENWNKRQGGIQQAADEAKMARENLASALSYNRFQVEMAQAATPIVDSMVGIKLGDEKRFGGWVARGILNWPSDIMVPTSNGTLVKASPMDYLDYIRRTGNWSKFISDSTVIARPDPKEDMPALILAHSEHEKLIAPLNTLTQEFYRLDRSDSAIEAFGMKFFDPGVAASEGSRLGIVAALRKPYTGGGNPSNFEQQMMLSAIPDPGTVFTLNNFNIHRIRTIALLSMLEHARNMQNHGLAITPDAIANYSRKYKNILGREITMKDFTRFMEIVDTHAAAWRPNDADQAVVNGRYNENSYNNSVGFRAYQAFVAEVEASFKDK